MSFLFRLAVYFFLLSLLSDPFRCRGREGSEGGGGIRGVTIHDICDVGVMGIELKSAVVSLLNFGALYDKNSPLRTSKFQPRLGVLRIFRQFRPL